MRTFSSTNALGASKRIINPKSPPPGWQHFNSHMAMPAEMQAGINSILLREVGRLLDAEGWDAFAMPKAAALAHEAGHCIIGAAEGLKIVRAQIFERMKGIWCGVTNEVSCWHIDNSTPTAKILSRVRYLLAGIAGETVLAPEHCHKGSSLDEIVISQSVCAGLWQECRGEFPDIDADETLWRMQLHQACCVIKRNEDVGRDLIRKLEFTGSLTGKPLAASLRRVKMI